LGEDRRAVDDLRTPAPRRAAGRCRDGRLRRFGGLGLTILLGAGTTPPVKRCKAFRPDGIPRPARSGDIPAESAHDPKMACSTSSAVAPGFASIRIAASPAMCGVAIEVPDICA